MEEAWCLSSGVQLKFIALRLSSINMWDKLCLDANVVPQNKEQQL